MRLHLISLSPSCFTSDQSLETTLKILNRLFHHTLITNYQDLYGKTIRKYGQFLNQNRVKDFQLLLLMYDKANRIVEVEPSKDQEFESLCTLNRFLYERGVSILHSKEQVIPMASAICSDHCFMTNEIDQPDILAYLEEYPIPPKQEIRLEKTHDREWINDNIYEPLLASSSNIKIVDPYIGREFFFLSTVSSETWVDDSQWVFGLKQIFDIFKVKSLSHQKRYSVHTAIRVDEEEKAIQTANEFRRLYLDDQEIKVKFHFYVYEMVRSPPDVFPHDRYILTERIGVNIGIGVDIINPDDLQVRRETQLTLVGKQTITSVLSQLRNLSMGKVLTKPRKILRTRVI